MPYFRIETLKDLYEDRINEAVEHNDWSREAAVREVDRLFLLHFGPTLLSVVKGEHDKFPPAPFVHRQEEDTELGYDDLKGFLK